MSIKLFYGVEGYYVNITTAALSKCYKDGFIRIPSTDQERAALFGDPRWGFQKDIKVDKNGEITSYDVTKEIIIEIGNDMIPKLNPKGWKDRNLYTPLHRLNYIHENLLFNGGNIWDELPEQLLATEFINPNAKVLELGSNIGRNTLVISSILNDESQFVTVECDDASAGMLKYNRDINGFKFKIENSALSARRLFQKGWDSFTEETKPSDAVEIKTIKWDNFKNKYQIDFDTLIVDCEGALYYILQDSPEILEGIKLIIMENDYHVLGHKLKVNEILDYHGFKTIKTVKGGWGPCYEFFYEVWYHVEK